MQPLGRSQPYGTNHKLLILHSFIEIAAASKSDLLRLCRKSAMTVSMSLAVVPEHYKAWLAHFEIEAPTHFRDCESCEQSSERVPESERFSRSTKCCTYFPFIPNFSLGGLFESTRDSVGLLRLREALARGRVTPLGLFPEPRFEARRIELGEVAFGRSEELLCPFYERVQGHCTIWAARPAVCFSYFCRSTYGDFGVNLRKNIEAYLNLFEWTLAHEVLWRLGFTQDDVRCMEEARKSLLEFKPRSAWGTELGFEGEFLKRCASMARMVTAEDVKELMGAEGEALKERIYESLPTRM